MNVCSFCGKKENEVGLLIASQSGCRICNECVQKCVKIINTAVDKEAP